MHPLQKVLIGEMWLEFDCTSILYITLLLCIIQILQTYYYMRRDGLQLCYIKLQAPGSFFSFLQRHKHNKKGVSEDQADFSWFLTGF